MFRGPFSYNFMNSTVTRCLIPILVACSFCRCASDQSSQGGDPVDQGAQGNVSDASLNGGPANGSEEASAQGAAMNNAVDNSASGDNFAGANNQQGGMENGTENGGNETAMEDENAALGAALNNTGTESNPLASPNPAALNSTMALTNPTANPLNTASTPLNNSVNALSGQSTTDQATPPANASTEGAVAAQPAEATPVAASSATDTISARAAASPFSNPHMNWPGKGKVKYVTRNVTRHATPNGPVVGEFEQGDHPLIFQNGNWVELHDGSFVRGNGLSEKAVGYGKGRKGWQ